MTTPVTPNLQVLTQAEVDGILLTAALFQYNLLTAEQVEQIAIDVGAVSGIGNNRVYNPLLKNRVAFECIAIALGLGIAPARQADLRNRQAALGLTLGGPTPGGGTTPTPGGNVEAQIALLQQAVSNLQAQINGKIDGVTVTAPLTGGGTSGTPSIGMPAATPSNDGYMTSAYAAAVTGLPPAAQLARRSDFSTTEEDYNGAYQGAGNFLTNALPDKRGFWTLTSDTTGAPQAGNSVPLAGLANGNYTLAVAAIMRASPDSGQVVYTAARGVANYPVGTVEYWRDAYNNPGGNFYKMTTTGAATLVGTGDAAYLYMPVALEVTGNPASATWWTISDILPPNIRINIPGRQVHGPLNPSSLTGTPDNTWATNRPYLGSPDGQRVQWLSSGPGAPADGNDFADSVALNLNQENLGITIGRTGTLADLTATQSLAYFARANGFIHPASLIFELTTLAFTFVQDSSGEIAFVADNPTFDWTQARAALNEIVNGQTYWIALGRRAYDAHGNFVDYTIGEVPDSIHVVAWNDATGQVSSGSINFVAVDGTAWATTGAGNQVGNIRRYRATVSGTLPSGGQNVLVSFAAIPTEPYKLFASDIVNGDSRWLTRNALAGTTNNFRYELSVGLPESLQPNGIFSIFRAATGMPTANQADYFQNLNQVTAGQHVIVFSQRDLDDRMMTLEQAQNVSIVATIVDGQPPSASNRITLSGTSAFTQATSDSGHIYYYGQRTVTLGTAPSGFGDFVVADDEPTDIPVRLTNASIPANIQRIARLWRSGETDNPGEVVFRQVGDSEQYLVCIVGNADTTFDPAKYILLSPMPIGGNRSDLASYIQVAANGDFAYANPLAPLAGNANDFRYELAVGLPTNFQNNGGIAIRRTGSDTPTNALGQGAWFDNINQLADTPTEYQVVVWGVDLDNRTITRAQAEGITIMANREDLTGNSSTTNRLTISGGAAFSQGTFQGNTFYYGQRTFAKGSAAAGDGDFNVHSVEPTPISLAIAAESIRGDVKEPTPRLIWEAGANANDRLTTTGATAINLIPGNRFSEYSRVGISFDNGTGAQSGWAEVPTFLFRQLGEAAGQFEIYVNTQYGGIRWESDTSFSYREGGIGLRRIYGIP